jgi:type IX secretion system PorP/SprF family membrane protein
LKRLIVIILVVVSSAAFSQQDMLFTHYMYNKMALNPGYAGSREALAMDMITRFQWVGIEGAPKTISFTAHTPLRNQHIGLGISAYRDEVGPTVDYNVMGTFAYRILFTNTKLCFGVAAGIKYFDIDWSKLNPKDNGDIELSNQMKNKVIPDVDFGIYYYGRQFYVGLSSRHLLQNQIVVSSAPVDGNTSFTKLMRHFYAMAGGAIPLSDKLMFMPSMLCKYVQNAPFQADINASFLIYNVLTLGASFRTQQAIGLLCEVNITKNFSMGYSYDIWFNALKSLNNGSHEIRLSYDLDVFDNTRMLTPRYF